MRAGRRAGPHRLSTPGRSVMNLDERQQLQDTVQKFATSVDTLDFDLYRAIFADECLYDVSSFSGAPPARVRASDWVAAIEPMLRGFDATQHFLSNFTFEREAHDARVGCYVLAEHLLTGAAGGETVTLGGRYTFTLRSARDDDWRIHGFRIEALWQRGNLDLYARAIALSNSGQHRRP
jgi:hypothetical protein